MTRPDTNIRKEHKKLLKLWQSGKATHAQIKRCRELDRGRSNEPDIRDKAKAAVCMLNTMPRKNKVTEMEAFLSIFHPEIPAEKRKEMSRGVGE